MRLKAYFALLVLGLGWMGPVSAQSPNPRNPRFVSSQTATGTGCPCRNRQRIPSPTVLVPTPATVSWGESWRVGMHQFLGRLIGNTEPMEANNVANAHRRVDSRWTRLRGRAVLHEEQRPTNPVPVRQQHNRFVANPLQVQPTVSRSEPDRGPVLRWVADSGGERLRGSVSARR